MRKNSRVLATAVVLAVMLLSNSGRAQVRTAPVQTGNFSTLEAVPAAEIPRSATFYLFSTLEQTPQGSRWLTPPLPCDPYAGQMPVYALNSTQDIYLIWDISETESYNLLQQPGQATAAANTLMRAAGLIAMDAEAGPLPLRLNAESSGGTNNGFGGSGGFELSYGSDDLYLTFVALTNQTAFLQVHLPETNSQAVVDLFETTNLSPYAPGLNLTNWLWVLRTDPG